MEEKVIEMSKKELTRLEIVQRVADKRMKHAEAARQLSLSERQIKRLVRSWREAGAAGLMSKRRGQPSNHRIDEAIKSQVLERFARMLSGFWPNAGGRVSSK